MSVNIIISDRRGRTAATSITLNAGDAMKPMIDNISLSIVQPSPASETFPSTYIANVSKVKISASYVLPTDAGVRTVTLGYSGVSGLIMSLNQMTGEYEVTTANPISDDTVFTVTIVDVRNMSSSKTAELTGVRPYAIPSVTIDSYYRCNQDRTKNDAGEYCLMTVTYGFTDIDNLNATDTHVQTTGYIEDRTVASGIAETYFFQADMERSYEIVVIAIDSITQTSKSVRLSTAGVIMDFLTGGKGIGFGKVAEYQNTVEVSPDWTLKTAAINLNGVDLGNLLAQIQQRLTNGGL